MNIKINKSRWRAVLLLFVVLAATSCQIVGPAPWNGPGLVEPRTQLTVPQLMANAPRLFVDMSFFARPQWADDADIPFNGTVSFAEGRIIIPDFRDAFLNEDVMPAFSVEFITNGNVLIPRERGLIETEAGNDRYWDIILGNGEVWKELNDGDYNRASFPFHIIGRYVGEVRNCVATFVYLEDEMSNVCLQCSQETAVLDAWQVGDYRAMLQATYEPEMFADSWQTVADYEAKEWAKIPTAPLSDIDRNGKIADHFDRNIWTSASTSQGAVYMDGTLYVNPPRTRHGIYPYPDEMRHGVFSVTKSMGGALAMFYFAERYGTEIFDALISDYVPALAYLPEWQGVTFSHALNMVTGTRAGESGDLLYYPLELAQDSETAIRNISRFGDYPEAPGEKFNYATTNTFVLSYALENYVKAREGADVHYWDLVRENVLIPIGAEDFGMIYTRDADPADAIPVLGLGAYPTLDSAAKITRLIANEGVHEGAQLLNRQRIREALGRTDWRGYQAWSSKYRYRHSFWSGTVAVGLRRVEISYMEGLGDNRVGLFPSGLISFQFTDEFDDEFNQLVRAVEGVRSSGW